MRMSRNGFGSLFALLLVAVVGLAPQPAAAQNDVFQTDLFGSQPPVNDAKNAIKYDAKIVPADAAPGDEVTLQLTATVAEGWHTFSLTQTGFGGSPTVIALDDHGPLKPLGKTFTASRAPHTWRSRAPHGAAIYMATDGSSPRSVVSALTMGAATVGRCCMWCRPKR